jgi:branched-chain amino acid transport system permease protein
MKIKKGIQQGLVILAVLFYLDLIGIPVFVGDSARLVLSLVVAGMAFLYIRRENKDVLEKPASILVHGLSIGISSGIGFSLITWFFASLQGRGIRIEEVFAEIKPNGTAALTGLTVAEVRGGANVLPGLLVLVAFFAVAAAVAGLLAWVTLGRGAEYAEKPTMKKISSWSTVGLPFLLYVIFLISRTGILPFSTSNEESNFGLMVVFLFIGASLFALRGLEPSRQKTIVMVIIVLLVLVTPQIANRVQNAILGAVMIFIVMGIGLNIVVGYAGLLDLGYVAFFAVGAYTYGLLSSPSSYIVVSIPGFEGFSFWIGLPLAFIIGGLTGVLLGTPVLKMRGDYLAIVTLGFGEIIRLLVLNLRDYTGGPGGVLNIPSPHLFGLDLGNPKGIMYLAMALGVFITFVTLRLHNSKLGRAWVALREDEDVAEAMGINLVGIKLLAFGSGAAFAALAGAVYAARQVNIFPDNFALDVSINVLSLIIIGGIGSIEGVVLGSIALIGLPEILRSVSEFRIIAFGALLVTMMIIRPEGFLPSQRRRLELHEEDAVEIAGD